VGASRDRVDVHRDHRGGDALRTRDRHGALSVEQGRALHERVACVEVETGDAVLGAVVVEGRTAREAAEGVSWAAAVLELGADIGSDEETHVAGVGSARGRRTREFSFCEVRDRGGPAGVLGLVHTGARGAERVERGLGRDRCRGGRGGRFGGGRAWGARSEGEGEPCDAEAGGEAEVHAEGAVWEGEDLPGAGERGEADVHLFAEELDLFAEQGLLVTSFFELSAQFADCEAQCLDLGA
jgi:hypothetical protein